MASSVFIIVQEAGIGKDSFCASVISHYCLCHESELQQLSDASYGFALIIDFHSWDEDDNKSGVSCKNKVHYHDSWRLVMKMEMAGKNESLFVAKNCLQTASCVQGILQGGNDKQKKGKQ